MNLLNVMWCYMPMITALRDWRRKTNCEAMPQEWWQNSMVENPGADGYQEQNFSEIMRDPRDGNKTLYSYPGGPKHLCPSGPVLSWLRSVHLCILPAYPSTALLPGLSLALRDAAYEFCDKGTSMVFAGPDQASHSDSLLGLALPQHQSTGPKMATFTGCSRFLLLCNKTGGLRWAPPTMILC